MSFVVTLVRKNPVPALVGAAVVGLVVWVMLRGVGGVAKDVAKGGVDLITGTASGVAIGIGGAFGIPETNKTQCEIDQAAGNTWAASASCPAGTFIKGLFS